MTLMTEATINQLIAAGVPALATVACAFIKGWFERRKADGAADQQPAED